MMSQRYYCLLSRQLPLLIVFFAAIAINAQEVYIANPFVQPNDSTLNWYGSGDANGDDTLTVADLIRMQEYIDGSYTPNIEQDRRALDRMDVNGDEIVNNQDYNIMQEHFQNRAPRDPDWYWANLSYQGKYDWLEKMLAIDKTENTCDENGIPGEICDCDQYSTEFLFNFHGTNNQKIINGLLESYPHNYDFEDMGRFNLPFYRISTQDHNSEGIFIGGHAANVTIFEGDFLNYYDLVFVEPQMDLIINKDIEYFIEYLNVGYETQVLLRGPPEGLFGNSLRDYTNWLIKDKIPELIQYNKWDINLITQKPSKKLNVSTNINSDSIYEVAPNVNVSVNDNNLKFAWISSDNGLTKKPLENGSKNVNNLPLPEGNNEIWIYAKDNFDRDTLIKKNLTINDIYNPRVSVSSPLENAIYQESPNASFSVADPNINPDSVYYTINDGPKEFFSGVFSGNLNLDYGEHVLSVVGVDKAGNRTEKKVNFSSADLTPPELNWTSDVSGTHSNNIAFNWNIYDKNFESAWLSNNGEKQNISQAGNIEFNDLPNGNYKFWLGAKDGFGNADSISQEFQVIGVGLEDKLYEEGLKVYPNPVKDVAVIGTPKGKDLYLEFYDVSGRLNKEIIDNDKDGITEVDFSDLNPGMYIIKASDENKNPIGTTKVVKR